MIALLCGWLTTAQAGGIGVYGEVSPGAAWSDSAGPLVRGGAARISGGLFWGPYRSTLQYGRYHRLGVQWGATSLSPYVDGLLSGIVSFGPEYGRGIDLLKMGIYWKVSVNAAVFVRETSTPDEVAFTLGAIARLTGGGIYWITRYFGINARIEGGPDIRGARGLSFGGGLGIGLIARGGVLTRQKRLRQEWEHAEYAGVELEEPVRVSRRTVRCRPH